MQFSNREANSPLKNHTNTRKGLTISIKMAGDSAKKILQRNRARISFLHKLVSVSFLQHVLVRFVWQFRSSSSIRTSDLEIPHRLLVVRVFVLLPEFTETRKTDVRCAHERTGRPWHGFIATWFDAVLLRLRVRDVREHVVELVRER